MRDGSIINKWEKVIKNSKRELRQIVQLRLYNKRFNYITRLKNICVDENKERAGMGENMRIIYFHFVVFYNVFVLGLNCKSWD